MKFSKSPKRAWKPLTKTFASVTNFLFVGGYEAAQNLDLMRKLGVTAIVVIRKSDLRIKWKNAIKYRHYRYADSENQMLHERFDEISDFIEKERMANGVVYVSCQEGTSRSVAVVLAYLVKYSRCTLRNAYMYVRSVRPVINVNSYFMLKLIDYEKFIRNASSVGIDYWLGRLVPDLPWY